MFCVHSNSVEPKVQHQDLQRPYHFIYSSINKKVILIDLRFRHNIAYFLLYFANKNGSKHSHSSVLLSEQRESD